MNDNIKKYNTLIKYYEQLLFAEQQAKEKLETQIFNNVTEKNNINNKLQLEQAELNKMLHDNDNFSVNNLLMKHYNNYNSLMKEKISKIDYNVKLLEKQLAKIQDKILLYYSDIKKVEKICDNINKQILLNNSIKENNLLSELSLIKFNKNDN